MATSTNVIVGTAGKGVRTLTLSRPESRNALDWETWECLGSLLDDAAGDDTVRAVILRGQGENFCAGGDVKSMGPTGRGVRAPVVRLRLAQQVIRKLWHFSKPTLAAVDGAVAGVGWSLVLSCDYIVASDRAFFTAAFAQRGLVPDGGLAWMMEARLGHQRAAELLYEGRRVSAMEALEWGLLNEVAASNDLAMAALTKAQSLSEFSLDALEGAKEMLRYAARTDLDGFLEFEELSVALTWYGWDASEGCRAFIERRPPRFGESESNGAH